MARGVAEDCVACALGGETPVVAGRAGDARGRERVRVGIRGRVDAVAVAPGRAGEVGRARGRVRLVAQVVAEYRGQAVGGVVVDGDGVGRARCLRDAVCPALDAHPVVDPGLLGVVVVAGDVVPEAVSFRRVAGFRAVIVEDDVKPTRACVVDDQGENVARVLALAGGAGAVGVGVRHRVEFPHRVGEGDADGAVAVLPDLVDDVGVVVRVEAVGDAVRGLEAVPVDARDAELGSARRDDLVPARRPARQRRRGCTADHDAGEGETKKLPGSDVWTHENPSLLNGMSVSDEGQDGGSAS